MKPSCQNIIGTDEPGINPFMKAPHRQQLITAPMLEIGLPLHAAYSCVKY
jgi:hypothetical protein